MAMPVLVVAVTRSVLVVVATMYVGAGFVLSMATGFFVLVLVDDRLVCPVGDLEWSLVRCLEGTADCINLDKDVGARS